MIESPQPTGQSLGEQETNPVTLAEVEAAVSRIGRLRAGSAVRRLAMRTAVSLLGRSPAESVQPLITALHDASLSRWRDREMAAWTIGRADLSDADRDAAAATLLGVLENAFRERFLDRAARVAFRTLLAGTPLALWALARFPGGPRMLFAILIVSVMILPIMTPISLAIDRIMNDRARAAAAEALGHLAVPEAVGPLAAALFDRNPRIRAAAAAALQEVLPALRDEHYGRLGLESMTALGRALSHPDTMLVFKLLSALRVIGTGSAAPYVEKVVQSGRTMKLKDTAAEVLVVLRERQRREKEGGNLLRPVGHAVTPLAAPISAKESVEVEQVLRNTTSGGQDIQRN